MEYDIDVFFETTIKTIVEDFICLLQGIANTPDTHISEGLGKQLWLNSKFFKKIDSINY